MQADGSRNLCHGVGHVSPTKRRSNEESESFIYIRDILFILADRPRARPRALASNDTATLIASSASPILSPVLTLFQLDYVAP